MGRPNYHRKKPAQKTDLNGNFSRTMKKEVKDVKTKIIAKYDPSVEMEMLDYVSGGDRMERFGSSGYKCRDCGKELNHWNNAVNYNNLRYHIETHQPRNKSCLICKQRRFRQEDSIIQHMENGDCWKYFRSRSEAQKRIYNFMIKNPVTCPYVQFSQSKGPLPLTYVKNEPGVIVKQERIEENYKIIPKLFSKQLKVPECPYICHDCDRPFNEAHSLFHHRRYFHDDHLARRAIGHYLDNDHFARRAIGC